MTYNIICRDSIKWLSEQMPSSIGNIITGIPDLSELPLNNDINKYLDFINNICNLIFDKVDQSGYCMFVQTDRKINKQWIDKSYYITNSALNNGYKMIWHKIVCRRDVGKSDLYCPTYSHVLCYSKNGTTGSSFPDVFPVGKKLYSNATPQNVADELVKFVKQKSKSIGKYQYDVVDPFIGKGTIALSCLKYDLNVLGIDIDKDQCDDALKNLSLIGKKIHLQTL